MVVCFICVYEYLLDPVELKVLIFLGNMSFLPPLHYNSHVALQGCACPKQTGAKLGGLGGGGGGGFEKERLLSSSF